MSWIRRLVTYLRRPEPDPKSERAATVIRAADRVLDDYRRQDAVLRLVKVPKR